MAGGFVPVEGALFAERYRVERLLGEGARKRVYLAHDTRLGRPVALAVIKLRGLDADGFRRLRREVEATARLGDHPNVVTIHDSGEHGGEPFLVTQYLEGGTLADLLDAAPGRRLPLGQTLYLVEQLCAALEHTHGNGVVHRDVKPANVWLARGVDGKLTPKLGDFGLAYTDERARLTSEGALLGTATYMPPEQAVGRPVSPASDLYSLGAVLYEMVTGRPPFVGDDPVAVVSQHLHASPVAPSWHEPAIPPALDNLIMDMLQKAPEDRPASAAAVRARLLQLGAGDPSAEPAPPVQANPLDRLAAGIFVGRERELATAREVCERAITGRGGSLLVAGEPGIGKTRLAAELTTYARLRGAAVAFGRCHEDEGAPAYWPWTQALQAWIHDRPLDDLRLALGDGAAVVAQILPELRERLVGLPRVKQLNPEEARFRLFQAIGTFIAKAAAVQPLVIALDDLQWADPASLLLLEFLTESLAATPVLLLGTYRSEDVDRQHPLARTLAAVARHEGTTIDLDGLDVADVGRFMELTARVEIPPGLAEAAYRRTEGNPFFLTEVMRLLISQGQLGTAHTDSSWSGQIPSGVRDVIGRRLDRLSPAAADVLRLAAVLGREFDVELLHRVAELDRSTMVQALAEAESARIIVELAGAWGKRAFSHALVRDVLYAEIPAAARPSIHDRVATLLDGLDPLARDAELENLARHALAAARGGVDIERAVRCGREAGDRALAVFAAEAASDHYAAALETLGASPLPPFLSLELDLLLDLGEAQLQANALGESRSTFIRAAALARQLDLHDQLAVAAYGACGRGPTAGVVDDAVIALLNEAVAVTPASPMLVKLLARLSVSHAYSPDRSLPVELSGRALELARQLDDADAMLHAVSARRASLLTPGGLAERTALDAELVDLARQAEDGKEIDAHGFLAVDHLEAGRRTEADAEIDRYAALADRSHLPFHDWWAHVLRAVQALATGHYEEGQRLADAALVKGDSAGSPNAAFAWASQVFTAGRDTGHLRELRDSIEPFADEYPDVPVWRAARAVQRAELGDREGAFADLEMLLAADIREDSEWMVTHALMADVAWQIRHHHAAATLLERLRPFAGHHVVVSVGVGYLGAVSYYLGLLAAVAEDWEAAEAWLRQATEAHDGSASPPWQARTQLALGLCLQRRGDRRDAAMDSFRMALELAEPIGMIAVARSARSLLAGDHRPTPAHDSLDALTASVTRDRPAVGREASLDGRLAVMFTDIEDYTAMTERLGDTAAQVVIQDHHAVVRKRVAEHGGFEVRSMGDGFMLTFPTPAQAVACAVSVQRDLSERRSDPRAEPLKVRAGVHVGPVIEDDGDFYGRTVIIAARITNVATGEEVLVSSAVRKELEGAFQFGPASAVHLKGLSGVYEICSVEWAD